MNSPVISLEQGYWSRQRKNNDKTLNQSGLITTPRITSDIRKSIWSITKARPYVLRAYFDTQLLLAESHGKMTHAYRQFFMGHKGDIEARYTTNKGRLTDEMISDMRRSYSDSQQFLCTINNNDDDKVQNKKEMLLDMWREQAKLYGIDPVKIKIEKQRTNQVVDVISKTSNDNEIDVIKTAIQNMIRKNARNDHNQKAVQKYESRIVCGEDELLSCVENGWNIVKELSNGKIILCRNQIRTSGQSD